MDLDYSSDSEMEIALEQEHIAREEDEIVVEIDTGLPDINVSTQMIPTVPLEQKPYEGREFQTVDLAYDFYNAYARVAGFSIRKDRSWNRKGGVKYHQFVCSKEGTRRTLGDGNKLKRRGETRCECKAMVEFKVIDGIYKVRRFLEEHNHVLSTPSKAHMHRSSKKISDGAKNLVKNWVTSSKAGPSMCYNVMAVEAGGYDKVGFDEQNIKTYIRQLARETYGNDAKSMLDYFRAKQSDNPGFFYSVQLDETGYLCNYFWVDARARLDYSDFGDVVSFDTTYKKNKYLMPFAPFTGVNHHRQSIVFGCALLIDEIEDSFVWLFEEWLRAMGNRPPGAIITDQDPAMKGAIAKVFPYTTHIFCMWHILQKVPEKLGHVYRGHPDFKEKWDICIYSPESVEEFEELWTELIREFNLEGIDWLKNLWVIRHMWVPSYLKDVFFAGMSTTQRSESMNDFFKDWVNVNTTLNDFVRKFDMAVEKHRDLELREDHKSVNVKPVMLIHTQMEEQLQNFLIGNIFRRFQDEFCRIGGCSLGSIEDGIEKKYKIRYDYGRKEYTVLYKEEDQTVQCSCKKFNFEGILCRHIFFVFRIVGLEEVRSQYILKRWRKDARAGVFRDPRTGITLQDNCHKSVTVRYNDLMVLSNRCSQTAAMHPDFYDDVKQVMQQLLFDLESKTKKRFLSEANRNEGTNVKAGSHSTDTLHLAPDYENYPASQCQQNVPSQSGSNNFITIIDPKIAKAKGSGKRIGRNCRTCGRTGHDSRNCPNKKEVYPKYKKSRNSETIQEEQKCRNHLRYSSYTLSHLLHTQYKKSRNSEILL